MKGIEESTIQEIMTPHNKTAGHLKMPLRIAIRIGQLLTVREKGLKHTESGSLYEMPQR